MTREVVPLNINCWIAMQDQGFVRNRQGDTNLEKLNQIRDKFEYDRERRMREKGKYRCQALSSTVNPIFVSFIHV